MIIGICDDEKNIRDIIEDKIKKLVPGAKVIQFSSGDNFLMCAMDLDLLFLDIRMPGTDGIQVAKAIRDINKDLLIVFVTGLEEYVFQAFDVGALHYLVKPIDDNKLAKVLDKAKESIELKKKTYEKRKSIIVSAKGIHTRVFVDEIIYAEVFNRKIVIYTQGNVIEYYGKLSDLQKMVGEDFFRPHRAYLINMKYVEKYDACNIYLEKGQVLMAKQNYKNFVESYMKYLMKG